jgi:CheY-like chemotaxis protein
MAGQRRDRERRPTVLVVEDEPTVRSLAESVLQDIGYATLSAANGREALVLLQAEDPIDLLFTDINMPDGAGGFDGLELARSAIELRPELSVLYTTGGARTDGMIALFVEKAGFLQKPYTRDQLLEALASLLPPDRRPR